MATCLRTILCCLWAALVPSLANASINVETAPDFSNHQEIVIDRPAKTIWPFLVDTEQWTVSHQVEHLSGKAGEVGARTRYTPKAYLSMPESERPLRAHHFGRVVRVDHYKNILYTGFSYNEGSYGGTGLFRFYLDYRLRDLGDGKTLVVFNGLGFYGNNMTQEQADRSAESSAKTMRANLQNLKALVEAAP